MWIPLVCKNFLRLLGSFCNQVVRTSASSNHLSPNQIFGLGLYCDVYIGASGYILCSSNTTRSAPPVPSSQSQAIATLSPLESLVFIFFRLSSTNITENNCIPSCIIKSVVRVCRHSLTYPFWEVFSLR